MSPPPPPSHAVVVKGTTVFKEVHTKKAHIEIMKSVQGKKMQIVATVWLGGSILFVVSDYTSWIVFVI